MPSKIQSLRRNAFVRQHGRCYYCGVFMWLNKADELSVKLSCRAARNLRCTAEHLVAKSDGGSDSAENIAAACEHCNWTRHSRKRPPSPASYKDEVMRRVALGRWHVDWVHQRGLLPLEPRIP